MITPARRGRKRKSNEIRNLATEQQEGPVLKKPPIPARSNALVGRYVKKKFEGSGIFIGKIVYYDSGLYRVDYEDGDCEDLETHEIHELLVEDGEINGKKMLSRKRKLDSLVLKNSYGLKTNKEIDTIVEVSPLIETNTNTNNCDNPCSTIENDDAQVYDQEDSSSDSSEHVLDREFEMEVETLLVPPLQLPPSSGTIGVPEEYVSHLFSVYSFLRSFSIKLFVYPFSLDDFVGSLNCHIPNTLSDAIHFSLLRVLKRNLEALSSDGSDQASKCLRCIDWSLLDQMTWPIYLVHYLIILGHIKRPEWKGLYTDLVDMQYYTLPIGKKLIILQILCDDVLDTAEIRNEIDTREESEFEIDSDLAITNSLESFPRRVHPRYSKTSASNLNSLKSKGDTDTGDVDMDDANSDECGLCGMDGTLLCCDCCPSAYHSRCIGVSKASIPEGSWFCPECSINKIAPKVITMGTSLRGAEIFGTDLYGQVFVGACSHLLVLKASFDTEPCLRYYTQNDIPKFLHTLHSSVEHTAIYSGLCKAILQYWKISENVLSVEKNDSSVAEINAHNIPNTFIENSDKMTQNVCLFTGSNFKSHTYFNHYIHGEFASSAASNLDILLPEPNPVSGSGHPKKNDSTNNVLQAKAFSSTATRFFWPNLENKLAEVPRERCGWCLSCQAPASSRKSCLLNAAVLIATRNAMKFLGRVSIIKNREGNLLRITIYILYMEESLRGLLVGPLLNASYRRHWHKQVEQASNFNELKSLLLELEKSIRPIALSADWVKLVDNWSVESCVAQNVSFSVIQTQKRGIGRPNKKQPACEVIAKTCSEESSDMTWWRGGKLTKLIHEQAILPPSLVKKAARLGGKRKITGVDYAEGSEIPRRSRQLIWRAAVEMSTNVEHLALQVRYLDNHIKWSDLCRPEQSLQESKGLETEISAFRNALICDKKLKDSKIMYGVTFGNNKKHLPSRVMKNIIVVEQDQDGKDKFWFFESRVPLYLIKEYEVKIDEVNVPSMIKDMTGLSKLQRRQLKASRKNAFSYLTRKRDNLDMCLCASCQVDVILWNAATCSVCQGYCHQTCTTVGLTNSLNGESESVITCKKCNDVKTSRKNETSNDSPNTPLPSQLKEHHRAVKTTTTKHKSRKRNFASVATLETCSDKNTAPDSSMTKKNRNKQCSLGLIWRKKKTGDKEIEDNGIDFRLNHLLLGGTSVPDWLSPSCILCQKPYNPQLNYIHCELCNNWYHGDAVELDESKISDLVGFKCCKCRRIRSPVCPYSDQPNNKLEGKKHRTMDLNQMRDPRTPKFKETEVNFENENTSGLGLRKLPVRRHVKQEGDESPLPFEPNNLINPDNTDASSPLIDWNISNLDYEGYDNEGMEFEPQTYFSFNELLEDGADLDQKDASLNTLGDVENLVSFTDEEFFEHDEMVCPICSKPEPALDLFCQTCGLLIHSHCSPWVESSSVEDNWMCGNCREWP